MRQLQTKSNGAAKPEWARSILKLRQDFKLSQTVFGQRLRSSAMAVSRWERGVLEPAASTYIELGNLAGAPGCWYFWGRAGLRSEDLMRVMPKLRRRMPPVNIVNFQTASAGGGRRKAAVPQLVAIPLLKVVAASHGESGDGDSALDEAPVEGMIAAPKDWCPNPPATSCLRVKGDSMSPLIHNGYILVVDSSQTDRANLNGKIVIAWNKDRGLTVSRLERYQDTDVLHSENREYEPIVMGDKHHWKILARVLWWIGKAP